MNSFNWRQDTSRIVNFDALAQLKNNHALLIDLREANAYAKFHLPDFINLPYSKYPLWQHTLPKSHPICFVCAYGKTAYEVAMQLYAQDYDSYAFSLGIEHLKNVPLKNDTYW